VQFTTPLALDAACAAVNRVRLLPQVLYANFEDPGGTAADPAFAQETLARHPAVTRMIVKYGDAALVAGRPAVESSPGDCNGVITVGATGRLGERASYSNYGPLLELSAPEGADGATVLSTINSGTTSPTPGGYGTRATRVRAWRHLTSSESRF